MVSASSAISPLVSRTSLRFKSPLATPVTTLAMPRTCVVRFAAIELTLSVRSFHVPATPRTCAWPPSLPSVPTSRATRVTSDANALSWSTIVLMVFLSSKISPRTSTVILRDRSPFATAVVTPAILRTWLVRLLAIDPHFARHARYFRRKSVELVHHRVDRVLELQNLALHVHRDLARQISARHGRRHAGDISHLVGQVAGHRINRLGQIPPRTGH